VCLTALKVDVDFRREGQISSKMDEGIDWENSKVSMRLYEGSDGDDDEIKIPFLCSAFRCSSFSPEKLAFFFFFFFFFLEKDED